MLEIADIIREAGDATLRRHGACMPPSHHQALRDLGRCRTPALGGQLWQCDRCPEFRFSYHSCRNRHCPKCQGEKTRRWLATQQARQLDCPYFLLTFPLPEELRPLARHHPRTVYSALMRSAAKSVLELAKDRRWLGGTPGIVGVLHTWTRAMQFHPHVHFLVTGGGLTADRGAWRKPTYSDFLMPGRKLSVGFRDLFRKAIGELGAGHRPVPLKVWRKKWVVPAKGAGDGERVLEYLSRYLHRVALPNSRLKSHAEGHVTFRYRDSNSQELQRSTLPVNEFLRRFLQHVLPKGLVKVRSYGLFASARKADLERARELLACMRQAGDQPVLAPHSEEPAQDPPCPACGVGRLRVVQEIPRPGVVRSSRPRDPPGCAKVPSASVSQRLSDHS